MANLPGEVIGNILSRLDSAEDLIAASATCKKWREARLIHLHAFCFNYDLLPPLTPRELEIIITKNVLQTKGLQSLSILMELDAVFSAASVIACIMHTRDTLRNFYIDVGTSPTINILELCNRQNLEELYLSYNPIEGVGQIRMKFPALKSLLLTSVTISLLDLSLLLTVCPKLEELSLLQLNIVNSDVHATMELRSASLKEIFVDRIGWENFKLDKFILEAASIETVHLRDCTLEHFELVGKGSLKVLQFEDVCVVNLDIGANTCNLEVVDVRYVTSFDFSNFTITWPKFYHMISRSSKLKKLRLWDIVFSDEGEVVNLETVSAWFPQLSQLSLRYKLKDGRFHYGTQCSSQLQNVTVLEVGWTAKNELFLNWLATLVQRCPRLKKLLICGTIFEVKCNQACPVLSDLTTAIFRLMRKYARVDVQFEYCCGWVNLGGIE